MLDLSFQQLLLRAGCVLLLSLVHGLALVLIARAFGDKGPQYDGRLTLNPFQHLDVVGAAALILFSYGWVRPVQIDEGLGWGKRLALILGSLFLTLLVALLLQLVSFSLLGSIFPRGTAATAQAFLRIYGQTTAGLVALNLIPLWPLTSGLVMPLVSKPVAEWFRRHQALVFVMLFVLIALGAADATLDQIRRTLTRLILVR